MGGAGDPPVRVKRSLRPQTDQGQFAAPVQKSGTFVTNLVCTNGQRVVGPRPAGTIENSPAIHRWVVARKPTESRQGRKNATVQPWLFFRPACLRGAPKRRFGATAAGAIAIVHPPPTVKTVGYFLSSLSGLSNPCITSVHHDVPACSRLAGTEHLPFGACALPPSLHRYTRRPESPQATNPFPLARARVQYSRKSAAARARR
jgi:hypothetical protein